MRQHRPGDLFVPLKGEWFDAFVARTKEWEYRLLRRQWNESQCAVGRRVTLCKGYSGPRVYGVITDVKIVTVASLGGVSVYPYATDDDRVIAFRIALSASESFDPTV